MRSELISRSSLLVIVLLLAGLATPWIARAQEEAPSDLMLILDASGSMWGQIEGENKIVIARRVVGELIEGLPDDQQVGLVAYGHRREGDCEDIELVAPIGPLDKTALKSTIGSLNPKGKTPITASIDQAFDVIGDRSASVILISDGLETCGGDPCRRVQMAREQGLDFVLHVVGFDVADEDVSSLECAAQAGGGQFHSVETADQLGAALEGAMAQPVDVPAGGVKVEVVANGELHDASVYVTPRDENTEPNGGRTYTHPETNPRFVPLPAGTYDVKVMAVGLKGDTERSFEVTLEEGEIAERRFDFSSGYLEVGVTRNGELSDATLGVTVAGTTQSVSGGRTYKSESSNPKRIELTSGTYDVLIGAIEISGKPQHKVEGLVVGPDAVASTSHDFASGTLSVGAQRGGELIDTTLYIYDTVGAKAVGQGRTYTSDTSNPKTFNLTPSTYRVELKEVGGDGQKQQFEIVIGQGDVVERMVEFP